MAFCTDRKTPIGVYRRSRLDSRDSAKAYAGVSRGASCVVRDDVGGLRIAETNQVDAADIVVHDVTRQDPSYAFALSRLSSQDLRYTPMGVFRSVQKPAYDQMMAEQLEVARAERAPDLAGLLAGSDTWTVEA